MSTGILPTAGDTTPPSAPTGLTATAGPGQVDLTWTASTDNVGVSGYRVERCQGAGCTDFAQVGTPTGTAFTDTGLAASTTYRYQVRAVDAAGNLSAYSSIATATTPAGGTRRRRRRPGALGHGDQRDPRSTWAGRPRPTTSGSPATAWSAARGRAAPTSPRSGRRPRPPSATSAWRRARPTATGCGRSTRPATSAPTRRSPRRRRPPRRTRRRRRRPGAHGHGDQHDAAIDLGWTASTDNVGVTGYRVERCQGAGCTNFAQVGTPTATLQQHRTGGLDDLSLPRAGGRRGGQPRRLLRDRHGDDASRAGHDGAAAPRGSPPRRSARPRSTWRWTASTDNVGVTGYRVERCQGASCTTFAQVATPTATIVQQQRPGGEHDLSLSGAGGRRGRATWAPTPPS